MGKRNTALDVLRIFSLFCVISVHFFLHNGFYNVPVMGIRMFVMVIARQFFMICVPLFLILTGYLVNEKELSKRYYLGITKTLVIYVLASIACILYKNSYQDGALGVFTGFLGILDFSAANYSWYIEMYIGLFLLAPFLNLIYHGLETKRRKQCLIATMVFLTALPTVLNIFVFSDLSWWLHPAEITKYQKIIPDWWTDIYPILYYFLGAYLKEYGLSIQKRKRPLLLAAVILFNGLFSCYRSYGVKFVRGGWQGFNSLFVVITSVLVFQIILDVPWFSKLSAPWKKLIKGVSDCVLGAYLLSYIFDAAIYPYLAEHVSGFPYRFEYYFLVVPLVFVCSLAASGILELLYQGGCMVIGRLLPRVKEKA